MDRRPGRRISDRRRRRSDHVFLLRHIGAGRAEVEIAGEEDCLRALADDVDRAIGAERRFGFVVELDDLDGLAENAAGGVDLGHRKLGADDGVGIDRGEPAAERHDQPEHRLVGAPPHGRCKSRDCASCQRGDSNFSDHERPSLRDFEMRNRLYGGAKVLQA